MSKTTGRTILSFEKRPCEGIPQVEEVFQKEKVASDKTIQCPEWVDVKTKDNMEAAKPVRRLCKQHQRERQRSEGGHPKRTPCTRNQTLRRMYSSKRSKYNAIKRLL
ncbi:hypothetical protein O181_040139 [Austropuccinia psidii MF-1]|uniref:Uncharacterized protein n=1 Tax=Austropuccinia psidii MF-1 TaxID=1389203 RepID=A0A9Q3HF79_9BASI|nr:hypothetical protein [Austropuccinia psidii MF-1]